MYEWLRRGRLYPESPEGAFVAEIDAADDAAERRCIELWQGHFDKDWRAIAEFMGRRWPTRWSRQPAAVEVVGTDGRGVSITLEERAEALLDRIRRPVDADAGQRQSGLRRVAEPHGASDADGASHNRAGRRGL
jgi:hypothetical protein